ncbi:response regulator [Paenibacillus doosanensis]|uniref:Response regulatory protein n=1 Tax=Paenibacillus konkukensis TaxID=2020716 RepID=A0ABY4RGS9_9BACL|nr:MULTISPECIES: response regulator [Paenibacillus]MCS7461056.1 response regulator [Paenibacillus doosanensis]UQZ81552.1 putative response regulatory protein [Paenibacillus konkukensis]
MQLLIVDDEPIIRKGLAKMAEQCELPLSGIETATNGVQALEIIREQVPDIIFTDIRMPKMDGLELCKQLHEQYAHIPIVVISGYSDFEYAQKCMSYGVKHYLLKPVTKTDVADILETLMKAKTKGFLSLTKYEDWIEQVEHAIWMLNLEEVERLTEQWKQYCLSSELNVAQLKELLKECITMLVKRLARKSITVAPEKSEERFLTREEAFADFDRQLKQLTAELTVKRSGNYKDPMKEAKSYIDNHLSQEITLEEVADMVGLTPTYFSSLFKKMTSETFVQYRIKRRIELAQKLMAVPHLKMSDIAAEVGYEDYPHFTKMFKKMTGYSPSEYRSILGIK